MKARGETVPLSDGLVDMCRYRERRAEKRVGGDWGMATADVGREVSEGVRMGTPFEVDGLRSGLPRTGAKDGGGVQQAAGSASCEASADGRSSACSSSSRKGVQK